MTDRRELIWQDTDKNNCVPRVANETKAINIESTVLDKGTTGIIEKNGKMDNYRHSSEVQTTSRMSDRVNTAICVQIQIGIYRYVQ